MINALLGGLLGFREISAAELQHEVADVGGVPFRAEVPLEYMSREDLGAVIAHLRTLPRTGEGRPGPRFTLLGRVLTATGALNGFFAADEVDHHAPFPPMPEIGANLATGEYLSRFCRGCHGADLHGGRVPDPSAPPAPNLLITRPWTEDQFLEVFRTGRTPEGRTLNPEYMPWKDVAKLSRDELRGLYMYLQTLQ